jgi:multiple sugar transport system permease protein
MGLIQPAKKYSVRDKIHGIAMQAYYGAQTARAVENFPISGLRFSRRFIAALGHVKAAAARANQQLKLLDSLVALIVTYAATNLPIVVWLMSDYFAAIPLELEESASVDGASPYRTFRSIILPVAVPGLVATFILVLVFAWNEYLIALFLATANAQTMPLLVAAQNATRGPQWWAMSVLILIMIAPVVAMAILLERYITRGLLLGALKG